MENVDFIELDSIELSETNGGTIRGYGWIGLLQPIYDFGCGAYEGWRDCMNDNR